ncbi:hypothetical protein AGMMS50268_22560 [Spirochaetia bacterium]|nr:hypothetical protein AGMMS50268_22560 [Spirochaetia bacterium]
MKTIKEDTGLPNTSVVTTSSKKEVAVKLVADSTLAAKTSVISCDWRSKTFHYENGKLVSEPKVDLSKIVFKKHDHSHDIHTREESILKEKELLLTTQRANQAHKVIVDQFFEGSDGSESLKKMIHIFPKFWKWSLEASPKAPMAYYLNLIETALMWAKKEGAYGYNKVFHGEAGDFNYTIFYPKETFEAILK